MNSLCGIKISSIDERPYIIYWLLTSNIFLPIYNTSLVVTIGIWNFSLFFKYHIQRILLVLSNIHINPLHHKKKESVSINMCPQNSVA